LLLLFYFAIPPPLYLTYNILCLIVIRKGKTFRSFASLSALFTGGFSVEEKMATTKKIQVFWLILATVFVAGIIWFVTDSLAVTAISGAFTSVIGIFIGVDIVTMIHKTTKLKRGFYKDMNMHRYVLSLCVFAVLLAEAFVISALFEREMNSLYLCFGVGFIIVIGGLINGLECNKIATYANGNNSNAPDDYATDRKLY
jgi:hypothetical protein